jgi:hypothetical protein
MGYALAAGRAFAGGKAWQEEKGKGTANDLE